MTNLSVDLFISESPVYFTKMKINYCQVELMVLKIHI